ncbi:histone H1.11R-like [Sorex araneus]|uniref:histone H1.11R-like n=1 Tax=Sorex araneus TaxID=42254 RepID=UPI0024340733|nr:histone H1.11R-like [Sorex araneus]
MVVLVVMAGRMKRKMMTLTLTHKLLSAGSTAAPQRCRGAGARAERRAAGRWRSKRPSGRHALQMVGEGPATFPGRAGLRLRLRLGLRRSLTCRDRRVHSEGPRVRNCPACPPRVFKGLQDPVGPRSLARQARGATASTTDSAGPGGRSSPKPPAQCPRPAPLPARSPTAPHPPFVSPAATSPQAPEPPPSAGSQARALRTHVAAGPGGVAAAAGPAPRRAPARAAPPAACGPFVSRAVAAGSWAALCAAHCSPDLSAARGAAGAAAFLPAGAFP